MDFIKKRWEFLSFRITLLMIFLGGIVLCGALGILPPIAVIFCFGLNGTAIWWWVFRPYFRTEKMLARFLEGYTLSDGEEKLGCDLSPSTKRLFEQLREVLSPAQLFNMNKRQAQYMALQNQINPHFLYNTLESIRSEVMIAGLDDVADMTEALATFFRYTITKVENLVSVEEELQNCKTYFSIQKYRFGDRLSLEIQYDPEEWKDIYRCRLPKLTMQPILENSIIHGTELKIGAGHLVIHLERTEKHLLIRVSDDGLGMDEGTLLKINGRLGKENFNIANQEQEAKGGLALTNVDNRIRLLFGDEYGLQVFSILGAGTDVEIRLPAITHDREVKNSEVLQ